MFEEERIGEFLKQLKALSRPRKVKLCGFEYVRTGCETCPGKNLPADGWEKAGDGTIWGGNNEYYAFRSRVTVPESFMGQKVEFCLLTGREDFWDATNPQFSVYVDGALRQGFDVNHHSVTLTECAGGNESFDIFLSAFTGIQNFRLDFVPSLETVDEMTKKLYYDLLVPYSTAMILEREDENYIRIMPVLTDAVNRLDLRRPGSAEYRESVRAADEVLTETFYSETDENAPRVMTVGATHIDIAWLWTLAVTRDKAVRSFSTALELMRKYPEFTFMSSQPQLYKFVRESKPEIYEEIKKRVAEGRWEPEGGMFLEPDCNLTSGESLVRQFLYGKKFFKEEFGRDSKILWLPDVFGYSAALPQIMKKCGVEYFMTTKISWNEVNKMPYDTFWWKGIDGTRVLSHFITTRDYVSKSRDTKTSNEFTTGFSTNYNGYINPSEIKGAWQRYQQKDLSRDILCSYGYGDGGGGPTEEMVETGRRLEFGIPGCPRTVNSSALGFFETLCGNVEGKKVPVWSGELYLEYHRGTYTSMANIKKYNRKGEFALENAESMGLIAKKLTGAPYRKNELDEGWEILLRNQFHDILPGSAVAEVYEDSVREYERLGSVAGDIIGDCSEKIAGMTGGTVVFNMNGKKGSGIAKVVSGSVPNGAQKTCDGGYIVYAENVPPKGYASFDAFEAPHGRVSVSEKGIETPFAKIAFDHRGRIFSYVDSGNGREILKSGSLGNRLVAYDDRPHKYDNWNIFDYYKETGWEIDDMTGCEVVEEGPVRYGIRFDYRYLDSVIHITYFAYPFTPRIDIRFEADWNESQTLLKARFPVDVNTDEATFEIQYGNVTRKTHGNTSWDAARFETCMHKWVDVSEGNYGVSFLNDCKYGVGIDENDVGISLLKCGNYPNPRADRGHHEAVYSVYPHEGTWQDAKTADESYALNNPMTAYCSGRETAGSGSFGLCEADAGNVMIEAVKQSESGDAVVIRLYEYMNRRSAVTVKLPEKAGEVYVSDMLENPQRLIGKDTDSVTFEIKPYEIVTLIVK